MTVYFKKALKILLPLFFSFFLIWWVAKDLTHNEIEISKKAFFNLNFNFLFISIFIGLLSHLLRAERWKYMLESMGYSTNFSIRYHAVMINYVMNLFIPRLGELARCTAISKQEKVPLNKVLGTIILERIIDFFILILMILSVLFFERDKIWNLINKSIFSKILENKLNIILSIIIILSFSLIGLYVIFKSENKLMNKFSKFLSGVKDGIISVFNIKHQFLFWLQSFLIWGLYLLGTYFCFLALPETKEVPFTGIVSSFVLAGIASIATQGGLGAYPIAFGTILKQYGVAYVLGWTFGWISWISQTLLILTLGSISLYKVTNFKK